MILKHVTTGDGSHYGYRFECPGCSEPHVIPTYPYPGGWTFNGDMEAPTFGPSILVHPGKKLGEDGKPKDTPRCHSFVAGGRIQFLGDCTHALAGQTAALPEVDS